MPEGLASLTVVWEKLWRRTSLTAKALFVSVFMGGTLWTMADQWQTTQVRSIFSHEQLKDLETQAHRDRLHFDDYIRQQERAVRLLSYLTPLVHSIEALRDSWEINSGLPTQWISENRPPWLPPRSVMRGMLASPYVLLLDAQKRVREIYLQEEGLPQLSSYLLEQLLPRLLSSDEHSHIAADADGTMVLINASGVLRTDPSAGSGAFLVLVVALNNDFLSTFHTQSDSDSIVALFDGNTDQVFASSQPDMIKAGTPIEQLKENYEIFGKKFLDYNFSIDIPVHFATLVSKAELVRISDVIVVGERKQRALSYGTLAIAFFVLVFLLTQKLKTFTEGMIGTAVEQLGLKKQSVAPGDQLMIMGEQFQWMIHEILNSRQRDASRREELQLTNRALEQSLTIVKRTQTQLVEAEKMASLGSLVAGVAHEINTPVGSGVTAASFLRQESLKCANRFVEGTLRKSDLEDYFKDVDESTQMILQNLNRAAELVRSFKQVAVDRITEQRRAFRLNDCIQQTLMSLRPELKKTRHKITVECPENLEINNYPGAFSQIISNFIVNSLMHGFQEIDEGEINIHVVTVDSDLVFLYSDNGCGMEEKDRVRIFEPFFTTARHRGGSGLGMHIVYNLVTQTLKGTIHCASNPGGGTILEIRLPKDPDTV
ncbi:MAG: HAMP histidine kinase [Magnetococcales bacterium]|nr:HAMP histidine kinase [Magnetococcales bacterium]HIJ84904.1 HAMP domain-containing histidine kinase [Magnetococcales bacterium]